jgi:hypothetical protein
MIRTILYGIAAGFAALVITWIVLPGESYVETAMGYMFLAAGIAALITMVTRGVYRHRNRS